MIKAETKIIIYLELRHYDAVDEPWQLSDAQVFSIVRKLYQIFGKGTADIGKWTTAYPSDGDVFDMFDLSLDGESPINPGTKWFFHFTKDRIYFTCIEDLVIAKLLVLE